MHQVKSWKISSDTFEKDFLKERTRAEVAEANLKEKEDEMAQAFAEVVKLRSDKEDLIDEYMDSQKFKDLMELHDEGLFHAQFTQGWNQAIGTVSQRHPGLIDVAEFVSPHLPVEDDDTDDFLDEDRIIDPEDTHPGGGEGSSAAADRESELRDDDPPQE